MVEVRYSIHFLKHLPRFGGVVEVDPSNFNWRRWGRGVVEVRYSIYFLQHLPRLGGVVEVEVHPINFSWRRHGRGGGLVWYRSDIVYILATFTTFWGYGTGRGLAH